MIHPLEAFADAIMQREGWLIGSRSWRNRNPGNLRPTGANQPTDHQGYRTFASLADGYTALRDDLEAKFSGHNSHALNQSSTVAALVNVWAPEADHNDPRSYCAFVCHYLTTALGKTIGPASQLSEVWSVPVASSQTSNASVSENHAPLFNQARDAR